MRKQLHSVHRRPAAPPPRLGSCNPLILSTRQARLVCSAFVRSRPQPLGERVWVVRERRDDVKREVLREDARKPSRADRRFSMKREAAFMARNLASGPSSWKTSAATAGGSSACRREGGRDAAAPVSVVRTISSALSTATNDVICWRLPSSHTSKSSALRPRTGRCCLSWTTTSTTTAVVEALNAVGQDSARPRRGGPWDSRRAEGHRSALRHSASELVRIPNSPN